MADPTVSEPQSQPLSEMLRIDEECLRFEAAWKAGESPRVEEYVSDSAEPRRTALLRELLPLELSYRRARGELPSAAEYRSRFPEHITLLSALFETPAQSAPGLLTGDAGLPEPRAVEVGTVSVPTRPDLRDSEAPSEYQAPAEHPRQIGRYQIMKVLGEGGFGRVFLAHDGQLKRLVAVKVPHAKLIARGDDAEFYLAEAQNQANLDHPNIVPVYDVGGTENFPCFIVSKFIEGSTLAKKIKEDRPSVREAAELVATVAEAVHYAHRKGLVHRDIKPGNILLDTGSMPFVADFGLALREDSVGKGPRYAGTPPYMSPEQARGEGHRVDGRSDIFSLGVVFYELLTGQRPFRGETREELLEQISSAEPRPPRQTDDSIPKELERICLRALSKRASERYTTAKDLADDLRHFFQQATEADRLGHRAAPAPPGNLQSLPVSTPIAPVFTPASDQRPIKIVPKGLRSFDEHDADFFLELLPGPRDRHGYPDSIRFWKTMIEADADSTFTVGLIYGPSGCGKSSLVKAGLLPVLAKRVTPIYIEATADETEARLLNGLRRHCPDLATNLPLKESLAALRHGHGIAGDKKILIVLDQFEQWLHAKQEERNTDLVRALRQCDGARVQCIVMVRDDFWLATTRFLGELEIDLLQGKNTAVVDLFDIDHARKVLAALGRALNKLPDSPTDMSKEQKEFLKQAVTGLAQDGKVICVRLALFAEMIKSKPWLPATLKALGGMEGVGVNFLEETFASPAANPRHRLHQKAARAVLTALIPEAGADIKGNMRSHRDLIVVSGYANRPKDFADLMHILDRETRLITPTDPEGTDQADITSADLQAGEKYYQLTHDYLVPSLRQWLTQERRRTWRGRAELCLEERTSQWSRSRAHHFLPSLLEYLAIVLGVPRRLRNTEQRALMQTARRFYTLRWGSALGAVFLCALLLYEYVSSVRSATRVHRAENAVDLLLNTSPEGVPFAIERLKPDQDVVRPLLQARFQNAAADLRQRLHAACALAALGYADEGFLVESVATAPAAECKNIVSALQTSKPDVKAQLRARADDSGLTDTVRVRYATLLLYLDGPGPACQFLAVASDPSRRTAFIHSFKSWHGDLRPLANILRTSDDAAFRSGMCAALGLLEPDTLGGEEASDLQRVLSDLYLSDADAGTHSAAGWTLRKWKAILPDVKPATHLPKKRQWFVNGKGMTMLRIAPGKFLMGDANVPDAKPHSVVLTRPFFMSDRNVSVDQFNQFLADSAYPAKEKSEGWPGPHQDTTAGSCPVHNVNLFSDAVLFCNWLSRGEALEPCYVRTGAKETAKVYQQTGQPKDIEFEIWQWRMGKNGYRLPTEAEWEWACRARSATTYGFGNSASLLPDYGVFRDMHTQPGASRLPNAWGLFDMHGNIMEWCWDRFAKYPDVQLVNPSGPDGGSERILRGGYFAAPAAQCSSGWRDHTNNPATRAPIYGFRVVCNAPKQDN